MSNKPKVYSLEFQQAGESYFYIGQSKNVIRRWEQHIDRKGMGAQWIWKKFNERQRQQAIPREYNGGGVVWEETKQTLLHMIKYGVNNVRGAEYCEVRSYDKDDANRIAYAAMHHLERTDKEAILSGLLQGIASTSGSLDGSNQRRNAGSSSASYLAAPNPGKSTVRPRDTDSDSRDGNKKYKTNGTSSARKFCIRCKVVIHGGLPLCEKDYSEWAKYKNDEYPEKFCNTCGVEQPNISYKKPQCRNCYYSSK
jgi:hypothetical protein